MGNLHKGHQELIHSAKRSKDNLTLLSIFINPLQFDDKEDLINYPRTLDKDIEIAFNSGADAIFIPSINEVYPNKQTKVKSMKASISLSKTLCGLHRKGHFDGVCTVINRLLEIIKPEIIYLGEKDWQQLLIIKKMVKDNNIKISIKSVDTQRDKDGIPFSSRNNLLLKSDREKLKLFSNILFYAKENFKLTKNIDINNILKKLKEIDINVEYLTHLNAFNLQKPSHESNITILAGAIICGNTRLIDHVFLMKRKPIIAIDGPAGAGKSTISKLLSNKLDFIYLDTGAMYRALSWYLIKEKINYENIKELNAILKEISITFKSVSNSDQEVMVNKHNVTDKIRSPEINEIVASIASMKPVREFLVQEQRKIGSKGGIVAEGRDIGSKVFPNSELKIFLTATINERAKRRKIDLENLGYENIDFEQLKNQIEKRDYNDSNREISPLVQAKDAIEIISDGLNVEEIVEQILEIYLDTIPKELLSQFK